MSKHLFRAFTCLIMALPAFQVLAESKLSATTTVASDYMADGISVTDSKPALQIGVDYEHSSGAHAGIWGSNIDSDDSNTPNLEFDLSAGFAHDIIESKFAFDVGATEYTYHHVAEASDFNYLEWYAGITAFKNTSFYYYYANDDKVWAGEQKRYILSHTQSITENWSVLADLEQVVYESSIGDDYLVSRLGVATSWMGVDITLSYWNNNLSSPGDDTSGERFVLEVGHTFDIATW